MTYIPALPYIRDDGGRVAAGRKGDAGDCVTRAICIATGGDYLTVYAAMADGNADLAEALAARGKRVPGYMRARSASRGVNPKVWKPYLHALGWHWVHTMNIGSGTVVHVRPGDLPPCDRMILRLSRHLTAVVDGTIRDTHDPSRDGTRAVYGIWTPEPWTWTPRDPFDLSHGVTWERA